MKRLRVVVAEDEALIRLDLKEMLEEVGHMVVGEAGDGMSAVELAAKIKPDLVIADIKMPVMDGLEAAEKIIEQEICPVLILTAYSEKELVERASRAGVMSYLVKPFKKDDLLPAIEVAMARYEEVKDLEGKVKELEKGFETRKLVDRAKGILMDTQGLTEAQAFRRIQKLSMDRRISMKEIAKTIIEANKAL
ncbi:two-component system, response regulator PdtaR [Candidatus Hakubella thermalkaliphila]|uniref:Two-component system, response regulator PdtaR n=1 Tax=Candidatus Hakubella thermalkaliphila TaxID=2754717 RepID=A0A6V8NR05_9ACTN|nr:response regulator [Candidatus Hakubella thermalkaliphila]GFP20836.1 two-component system, response regulator PdtaR [Candidatus Hakubella thermalkaliphila]GFP26634.1 two-component system, response regulator PdtaR [Candidatus Hakubella thermalkaliphila]GFP34568.1 two-component system, response regulator PdtaR [Candidatus Hakubella thermalkaliphila]GFP42460.1 two-component system, response regulator PdtaR [Candidatus Hakubella thermalkaliphila]